MLRTAFRKAIEIFLFFQYHNSYFSKEICNLPVVYLLKAMYLNFTQKWQWIPYLHNSATYLQRFRKLFESPNESKGFWLLNRSFCLVIPCLKSIHLIFFQSLCRNILHLKRFSPKHLKPSVLNFRQNYRVYRLVWTICHPMHFSS